MKVVNWLLLKPKVVKSPIETELTWVISNPSKANQSPPDVVTFAVNLPPTKLKSETTTSVKEFGESHCSGVQPDSNQVLNDSTSVTGAGFPSSSVVKFQFPVTSKLYSVSGSGLELQQTTL